MNIMLQGYLCDANFGDVLFAHLFYKRCLEAGFQDVDFFQFRGYGIGAVCRKELGYTRQKSLWSCFCADAFVLISGGSFWNDSRIENDAKIRFRRFILPALIYQFLGKPVWILGVGGGPVDTIWLRKMMVKLLNKAKTVYFRDELTNQIFSDYGVKNKTLVTADTALVLKPDMLEAFEKKDELEKISAGRKKLLFHIPDGKVANQYVADIVTPGLIPFLKEHKEYLLVLSNDNIRDIGSEEKGYIENIRKSLNDNGIEFYDYIYHSCWQMCSLINEMDCLVTSKLHVGVVGAALGKSVVAFPIHREKTDEFYKMIGESDRCINLRNLNSNTVYGQMNKFHDKQIHISDELRMKAEMNLKVIDDIANKKNAS